MEGSSRPWSSAARTSVLAVRCPGQDGKGNRQAVRRGGLHRGQARDDSHAYDNVPAGERPTFHEIRALGAWLYEQQGFAQEYIQGLMGHADVKMTEHYQSGHGDGEVIYMKVKADLNV